MRTKFIALILLFVFGSVSLVQAKSNQKVVVKINEQKTVAKTKLTIKFVELVEDSRCPTDAQCIQAGSVRIKIEVKNGKGAAKTFELAIGAKPESIAFAGYTIKLTDLNPHPASNIRIDRNGYTANFTVGKSGK